MRPTPLFPCRRGRGPFLSLRTRRIIWWGVIALLLAFCAAKLMVQILAGGGI